MARSEEKNNYNAWDFNNGIPPKDYLEWNGAAWVPDRGDTIVVYATPPVGSGVYYDSNFSRYPAEYFQDISIIPEDVRYALQNNMCILCGEVNCPYIGSTPKYKDLLNKIKAGDAKAAVRSYTVNFAQLRGNTEAVLKRAVAANNAAYAQALLNRQKVLVETSEAITSYGENLSKEISKSFTNTANSIVTESRNFRGTTIRNIDQAMDSMNRVLNNPALILSLSSADRQAITNAFNKINMDDFANKFQNLGKFFKAGDIVLKGKKLREKAIEGNETGNWKPLALELEAIIVSSAAAGIGFSLYFSLISVIPLVGLPAAVAGIIGVTLVTFAASYIDDKFVDQMNNIIVKPAH